MLNLSAPAKGKSYKGGMQAYVKNMMEVGKVAKYLKGAGYLGIVVDVFNSGIENYNATPEEKTRTTVVEGTKIATGVGMGVLTTYLVIGVATGGAGLFVLGLVAGVGVLTTKAVSDVSGSMVGLLKVDLNN